MCDRALTNMNKCMQAFKCCSVVYYWATVYDVDSAVNNTAVVQYLSAKSLHDSGDMSFISYSSKA